MKIDEIDEKVFWDLFILINGRLSTLIIRNREEGRGKNIALCEFEVFDISKIVIVTVIRTLFFYFLSLFLCSL